jgi:hypothetical protein
MDEKERIRLAAFNITSAFEGNKGYAMYQTYDAGIISYGRFQFTLASGSLASVMDGYLMRSNSPVAQQLRAYQARIKNRDVSLRNDTQLQNLLVQAAAEKAMQDAQDEVVVNSYWIPSQDSVSVRGIQTPLGQALLFDMAIQHGPANKLIRKAEEELGVPPRSRLGENGLTEQQLIRQVVDVRRRALYAQAERDRLPGLKRRADFWVDLVQKGDWQLQGDANGNVWVLGAPVQVRNPGGISEATPAAAVSAEAASAIYIASATVFVRQSPDVFSPIVCGLARGSRVPVIQQYAPSANEEWLKIEGGWVPRRHPAYGGQVLGELTQA